MSIPAAGRKKLSVKQEDELADHLHLGMRPIGDVTCDHTKTTPPSFTTLNQSSLGCAAHPAIS